MLFGPCLQGTESLVTLIRRFEGLGDGNLNGEVPTAVHASLLGHIDPGADHHWVADRTDIVQLVDLALRGTDVPEEVNHSLDEFGLHTAWR